MPALSSRMLSGVKCEMSVFLHISILDDMIIADGDFVTLRSHDYANKSVENEDGICKEGLRR